MNVVRKQYFVISELPQVVTLTTSHVLEDHHFELRKCNSDCATAKLRELSAKDCIYRVTLSEDLAANGPGHYELVAVEGCDDCDKIYLEFTADCKIVSAALETGRAAPECDCE